MARFNRAQCKACCVVFVKEKEDQEFCCYLCSEYFKNGGCVQRAFDKPKVPARLDEKKIKIANEAWKTKPEPKKSSLSSEERTYNIEHARAYDDREFYWARKKWHCR